LAIREEGREERGKKRKEFLKFLGPKKTERRRWEKKKREKRGRNSRRPWSAKGGKKKEGVLRVSLVHQCRKPQGKESRKKAREENNLVFPVFLPAVSPTEQEGKRGVSLAMHVETQAGGRRGGGRERKETKKLYLFFTAFWAIRRGRERRKKKRRRRRRKEQAAVCPTFFGSGAGGRKKKKKKRKRARKSKRSPVRPGFIEIRKEKKKGEEGPDLNRQIPTKFQEEGEKRERHKGLMAGGGGGGREKRRIKEK